MSFQYLFHRKYDRNNYNCAHFVVEVWRLLADQDIEPILSGFLLPPKQRKVALGKRRQFKPIQKPESPCLVAMHRPKSAPHVGMYWKGKVLHIHENGVEYMPVDVASRAFKTVRFYVCL